jgi:hypothetical protein
MHISTTPMFYLACKDFPLILTRKGLGFINQNFPFRTNLRDLKKTHVKK